MKLLLIEYLYIGEGIVASITLGIMSYLFNKKLKLGYINSIIFAWFITWLFRRIYLNTAKYISNYNKLKKKGIYINI